MIKAEVITHEGNPGPNWLDRCRNLVSPGKMTALVISLTVIITIVAVQAHRNSGQANQTTVTSTSKQVVSPATGLQVVPLADKSTTAEDKAASLQSANGGSASSSGVAPTNSANALGPTTTPSLNTSKNASQATSSTPATNSQLPSSGSLTQNVQSGMQSTKNNATKSLADVKTSLGL